MKSLHIIYASGSGHTEYVVNVMAQHLKEVASDLEVEVQRVDSAKPADLHRGDVLILGCGTWNTGGVEGQMEQHMYDFLRKHAKDEDLKGKPVGIIALGDDRYFYTGRSGEHIRNYIQSHNGTVVGQTLTVINEPYGQEDRVTKWADKFISDADLK